MSNPAPESDEPQVDQEPVIRVLAAVIQRDGRYLVCRRPSHKRHGGLWEFPGGKLEPGETLEDAARRELEEELGVSTSRVSDPVYAVRDPGSEFLIEFSPVIISGRPRAHEHEALQWATVPELRKLELAPSDACFVREWLSSPPRHAQ